MKCIQIEKKPPKKFRPPPKPSAARAPPAGEKVYISGGVPPPPLPPGGRPRPPPHPGAPPCPLPPPGAPPPPPRKPGAPQPPRPPPPPGAPSPSLQPPGSLPRGGGGGVKVQRVPELVEFYNSLMKRDSKKDTRSVGGSLTESDAKSNLLGEMQSKLWFLQAVKADVETQGEFVKAMAVEVRAAAFSNIEDVVAFVNWLDEELSFLVDECAVLKYFDWPETGASTLREAASQYQELMRLNLEVTSFVDDPKLPCESALSKMHKLREKVEKKIDEVLRTRDITMSRYRKYRIPVDWLSNTGVTTKIKISYLQLAKEYMKRITKELDTMNGHPKKESNRKFLLVQGVRFAFQVHQSAGGFDEECTKAFEEIRSRVNTRSEE